MVTEEAKRALRGLLPACLNEALEINGDAAEWKTDAVEDPAKLSEGEFFMLTISSYEFRILTLLHFTANEATRQFVAERLQIATENLDDARYYDYLGEVGNSFCGVLKRRLGEQFRHLGMSTPSRLSAQSLTFTKALKCDFDNHVSLTRSKGPRFLGSVYVSSYGEVNIAQRRSAEVEEQTGELELF